MSKVTNLLLYIGILEDEDEETGEVKKLAEVNQYFTVIGQKPLMSLDDPYLPEGWYGGSKMLECHLYVGAFNYLDLDDFLLHLQSLVWEEPESLQVIVKEQDDDVFRIIDVFEQQ